MQAALAAAEPVNPQVSSRPKKMKRMPTSFEVAAEVVAMMSGEPAREHWTEPSPKPKPKGQKHDVIKFANETADEILDEK